MAREGILLKQVLSFRLFGFGSRLSRAIYSTINNSELLPEQGDVNGGNDDDGNRPQTRIKHSVCLPTVYIPRSLELAQENLISGTYILTEVFKVDIAVIGYSNKQLASDGAALMKYLRTRQPPSAQDQKMKQKRHIKTESGMD